MLAQSLASPPSEISRNKMQPPKVVKPRTTLIYEIKVFLSHNFEKIKEYLTEFWSINLRLKKYRPRKSILPQYDISFLVCDSKGWILEGICKNNILS